MSRPLWFVEILKKTFPYSVSVAKLTKIPFIAKLVDYFLFEEDDIIFVPNNRVIEVNKSIEMQDEMVLPSQVVEHFIEEASYLWIMNKCLCRDASDCQNYPIDLGCLFMGEAARGINPELGHPVSKDEARAHIRRAQEVGLIHMVGRNKLDTVWMGVAPREKLLTVCSCCPCCCLWRVLPHLAPQISHKLTKMPGVTVRVTDRCVGCGLCTRDICFVDAIKLVDDRAVITDECRGCGQCVRSCPHDAIEIEIEHDTFVDEAVARISAVVDVK